MDIRRANRNLRLALDGEDQVEVQEAAGGIGASSSLSDRDMVETQVPDGLEFSSSPQAPDGMGEILVSTQVQSRLDDVLQEEALQDELKRFKYDDGSNCKIVKTLSVSRKRKATRRSQQSKLVDFSQTKAGQLLKRLSGKQKKVKDLVDSKGKRGKVGTRSVSQYDTYNAEEWEFIHRKLLEHFPHSDSGDVNEIFRHLCRPPQSCNENALWIASQVPPDVTASVPEMESNVEGAGDRGGQETRVFTLSQVLGDDDKVDPEPVDIDDDSTVPDSTEEVSICIPIAEVDRTSTQFYTPRTSLAEEIIDLTQESFKVVKSLISPLKDEETPLVQVPATRTSTILTHVKLTSKDPDLSKCVKMVIPRSQTGLLKEKLSREFDFRCPEEDLIMSDTDDCEHIPAYLHRKSDQSPSKQALLSRSRFASQSAQKLRKSIKAIGLKPCRSKSEMIASLEAASQVLDASATELEQRHLIYNNLTDLVYSCPSLLERVYTFQPIPVTDLVARLTEANPFIDRVDEPTIRMWAEGQGICLSSSN